MIGLAATVMRQAATIAQLLRIVERQTGRITLLERERDEARADAEPVLSLVPDDLKRDACALVRTRHEITHLDERRETT